MKTRVAFDPDGTAAESKWSLDSETPVLRYDLLALVQVAVISGGDWPRFEKQLLSHLPRGAGGANLSPPPTCGTKFFQNKGS